MPSASSTSPIDLALSPADLIARWPAHEPLAAMVSGRPDERFARCSMLASPRRIIAITRTHLHEFNDGDVSRIEAIDDPLRALDAIMANNERASTGGELPGMSLNGRGGHNSGWMLALAYRLGQMIEPAARRNDRPTSRATDDQPLFVAFQCPATLTHDTLRDRWSLSGDADECARLQAILARAIEAPDVNAPPRFTMHGFAPDRPAADYEASVARVLEYIRAGDIFQANIARRFTAGVEGSARALAATAFHVARPLYGAYLELPSLTNARGATLLSLSPELYLHVDPATRIVRTRPIKGTRPPTASTDALRDSSKDAAELHMIVDLMRNDLGRVCAPGSIHVHTPRAIERHPTVTHAVAEVAGTLRDDASLGDLLRATFPPGSVTGAPKIRAMQIIDELEGFDRGFYCGAIGWLSAQGELALNVAIRTAMLRREVPENRTTLEYCAGAGIVADSVPADEAAECHIKAAVMHQVAADMQSTSRTHGGGDASAPSPWASAARV